MELLFEVPYNFTAKLLQFYKLNKSMINFLYLPPYKEDLINTRSSIETHKKGWCYMPQSRSEYESHLSKIKEEGLDFVILWQDPQKLISTEMLEYYVSQGTSGFIIGNNRNAELIKNYNNSLIVIASLVQRIYKNILSRDFKLYNKIILYYPFNRGLDALKELNNLKEKLVIMPNSFCHIDCPSVHHWFPNKQDSFNLKTSCPMVHDFYESGFISPKHLHLFDDLVSGYKLQGREYPTDVLIHVCKIFFNRESPDELLKALLFEDQTQILINKFKNENIYEYYNIKSEELRKNL